MSCNNLSPEEELAAIDAVLNAGVTQSSMDGQTVSFDLKYLESRRRELASQSLTAHANRNVRPVIMRANFSQFMDRGAPLFRG